MVFLNHSRIFDNLQEKAANVCTLLNYLFSENVFGQIINSLSKNTQLREIDNPENLQFYEKVILLNYLLSSNVTGQMLLGKIRNCAKFLLLRTSSFTSNTHRYWHAECFFESTA